TLLQHLAIEARGRLDSIRRKISIDDVVLQIQVFGELPQTALVLRYSVVRLIVAKIEITDQQGYFSGVRHSCCQALQHRLGALRVPLFVKQARTEEVEFLGVWSCGDPLLECLFGQGSLRLQAIEVGQIYVGLNKLGVDGDRFSESILPEGVLPYRDLSQSKIHSSGSIVGRQLRGFGESRDRVRKGTSAHQRFPYDLISD